MSHSSAEVTRAAIVALVVTVSLGSALNSLAAAATPAKSAPKKIVFLAGTVHQGPGGHPPGTHEYALAARLLKRALDSASNVGSNKIGAGAVGPLRTEIHLDGWPRDPRTLDDADTIVVLSDGADRNRDDHPLLVGDRLQVLKKQMDRGCGLVAIHWTVFVPQEHGGDEFLEWIGGYFDYESGPAANNPAANNPAANKWFSKIQTTTSDCKLATPNHPIARGLKPFSLREEYYYNIRFRPNDPRLKPILTTAIPGESQEQTVAWAVERNGGGRGFGFTGGHFFENWGVEEFRRMVANAILWTAHVEVPAGGLQSAARVADEPIARKPTVDRPDAIQCLLVTGHQHPAHVWSETTVALQEALARDKRIQVTVVTDPEFLAKPNLQSYDVVLLNYCNWQRGGLSDAAKANFQKYLSDGGGLAIVHFTNGAFHASLPETPASDWPEFRNICRRVWDHAPGKSSHDPYGRFQVEVVKDHPITEGLNSFETIDELYCNQQGDGPIEVLATARSTVTGRDEPMAFVYPYGRGRIFQTVLGHAAESIRVPGEAELMRRGVVWAAGRTQRKAAVEPEKATTAPPRLAPEGRFGAALDPRPSNAAWAARQLSYEQRPLTVECWAKLNSKSGFNILMADGLKESAEHWELYTYAGSGELSLYLPGFQPAEIRSGVDVTDGQWHYVAATFDESQANLFVDGRRVTQVKIDRTRSGGPNSPLYFGGYPPGNIGCDGMVDEVRISKGLRAIDGVPAAPLEADASTVGLWRFDRVDRGGSEDASATKNPAITGAIAGKAGPMLARWCADEKLKLVSIDSSPDESFLALRTDTMGRLFAGGREALFVYEPDPAGVYGPRQLLYRFPPDTWITDIEVRGDDLYAITNAALYLFPRGRLERTDLKPRRLVWGPPVDLHVTYHGLAWGPEGDLYFCSGDPLLNFGDFASRPDHWGHWTVHSQPNDTRTPYTGVGGFFRCRPDGSRFQVVASGTRGTDGLTFDRRWNLFSNDNDHESLADRYSPARLLHVAPQANFFWPRGWIASMSPDRADLLEVMNDGLGREAPVGIAYYDDPLLGERYRNTLLLACWGQRKVAGFTLVERGASFRATEFPFLQGAETARPVSVTVGRGGRVFVALSYMAGNEGSPKYPSELVMVTTAADPPTAPFEAYDAPTASPDKLWSELASTSTSRRQQAHQEILRRGGALLVEAARRLPNTATSDPAFTHLAWLAGASGAPDVRAALTTLAAHRDAPVRATAIRVLAEFPSLAAADDVFELALSDANPLVMHAGVVAWFDRAGPLPLAKLTAPAASDDTYLRQATAFLLARRASELVLDTMLNASDGAQRLSGVLAAGFRLTVPPATSEPPSELPLRYESGNATFSIQFADELVDLKQLGRAGSFTTAERWKTVPHTPHEQHLFDVLLAKLDDADDRVALQAGYFLGLLDDPAVNERVTQSQRRVIERRLRAAPAVAVNQVWQLGPLADGPDGIAAPHPPESGPIDLSATFAIAGKQVAWQLVDVAVGLRLAAAPADRPASSYLYFRLQSLQPERAMVELSAPGPLRVWHNGRAVEPVAGPVIVNLEPGGNDVLIRLAHATKAADASVEVRAAGQVVAVLPEKLGLGTLAERLQQSSADAGATVAAEFLKVDWSAAAASGDAERGRRLFSADALGCVRCHAILPNQKGGGAPSLSGAKARFNVSQLVESILAPGKQVAPVFSTTTVVTLDGLAHSGLVVEENDRELVLLLPTAARQSVPKTTIETRKLQPTSPMPAGLVKAPAELADLLAYLLSDNPRAP